MSVSVFFSNKNIQIVVGKCKGNSIYIDKLIESPMPENAILNGRGNFLQAEGNVAGK